MHALIIKNVFSMHVINLYYWFISLWGLRIYTFYSRWRFSKLQHYKHIFVHFTVRYGIFSSLATSIVQMCITNNKFTISCCSNPPELTINEKWGHKCVYFCEYSMISKKWPLQTPVLQSIWKTGKCAHKKTKSDVFCLKLIPNSFV